jgi:DNA gyrase subunit A
MKLTKRTGKVAGMRHVEGVEDILVVTAQGMLIRLRAPEVRKTGRVAQGVKLIVLEPDDRVVSVARLAEHEDEEDQEPLFEET